MPVRFLLILFLFLPTGFASAAPLRARLLLAHNEQPRMPVQQAVSMVQSRLGGRVLAVIIVHEGGRVLYRLKVLTSEGEVRIVHVDAATGEME